MEVLLDQQSLRSFLVGWKEQMKH